ncbi:uncharacterized protein K452DRAFT_304988 [Aplosporella prunicola CBS 121167]|uniref:Ribosome biogenesis protein NSA1 n=1 Tax=Aplosporella prunicola CBS 121167 TaxID=1176127 RepID=A0A6A6BRB8_9PEZI|nr:uncharacterized protein K452DRAFT_304988 [Aplosporella prunicola CBS 121167]KAF2145993.1 hypothetical protein K452DRAFT_304988 [Aplosporella prunicola CBS 121167]
MAPPPKRLEIPGMYYDEEKNRYFKLEKHHHLTPSIKHSIQSHEVAKREKKRQKRIEAKQAAVKKHRITRSRLIQSPWSWSLKTEVNGPKADPSAHAKGLASVLSNPSQKLLNPSTVWSEIPSTAKVTHFDYDTETRTIIASVECGMNFVISASLDDMYPRAGRGFPISRRFIETQSTAVSSLHINSNRNLITTTRGESAASTIQITPLRSPQEAAAGDERIYGDVKENLSPYGFTTIWSSASNPFPNATEIAVVGTSEHIIRLERDLVVGTWDAKNAFKTRKSDPLAMDWLSPQTVAVGFRNGFVALYDPRTSDHVMRMRHSRSVIGLKRADNEHRLIVTGFKSKMDMYDLRMSADGKGHHRPNKQHNTKPYLSFDYQNDWHYPLGFDVHYGAGLVAAAHNDGIVQLYSMRSGAKVRQLRQPVSAQKKEVTCLKFVEEVAGVDEGRTKLLGSAGCCIMQWV